MITAYESVLIYKELEAIKAIVEEHDNYFFCRGVEQERLEDMITAINDRIESIQTHFQ